VVVVVVERHGGDERGKVRIEEHWFTFVCGSPITCASIIAMNWRGGGGMMKSQ